MKLVRLSPEEVSTASVGMLGLDASSLDLESPEAVAACLRRAASFMCPTSPRRLVDAVVASIEPIAQRPLSREDVSDLLEQLLSIGDLLELREEQSSATRLLYLAPPSYIERRPGSYLLMGIRPFGAALIDDDFAELTEYEGHARRLTLDPVEGPGLLQRCGLRPVKKERWVASPAPELASNLIERHRARLGAAREAGDIEGLQILDPLSPTRYYRGRWRSPIAADTGDFLARRPQAYGADLWCLVRLDGGVPQRLLELPLDNPVVPGRDEAWRFQAAVDATRATPQQFRMRPGASPGEDVTFDFFSPLPSFAERYVELLGIPLGKAPGALFSFRVPANVASDVEAFLIEMLWMTKQEDSGGV